MCQYFSIKSLTAIVLASATPSNQLSGPPRALGDGLEGRAYSCILHKPQKQPSKKCRSASTKATAAHMSEAKLPSSSTRSGYGVGAQEVVWRLLGGVGDAQLLGLDLGAETSVSPHTDDHAVARCQKPLSARRILRHWFQAAGQLRKVLCVTADMIHTWFHVNTTKLSLRLRLREGKLLYNEMSGEILLTSGRYLILRVQICVWGLTGH